MILAAGRGERMRPLTDHTPKPLLQVGNRPLLEHHILCLAQAGFDDIVINVSHLGEQIADYCGDGGRWGVRIRISCEETPLETAGGIVQALPMLGEAPFLLLNGDIWLDYPLQRLRGLELAGRRAHLVLVDSPPQHPLGDFCLQADGLLRQRADSETGLTYAGLGIYDGRWFAPLEPGFAALRPMLNEAIAARLLGGEYYRGQWVDVGTPERLQALDESLHS